jgi:hypothetical protein
VEVVQRPRPPELPLAVARLRLADPPCLPSILQRQAKGEEEGIEEERARQQQGRQRKGAPAGQQGTT